MAHRLRLKVVAEGVETDGQLALLAHRGCDHMQGYYFSRPVRAEEFAQLLGNRSPKQIVHQCGSGVSACHNILAMEIAGLAGSRLYPGSWSEWCADPKRPIATGSE